MAHIRQLTGVRAVAAGWVVLLHLRVALVQAFPPAGPALPLINLGYLGVDLFFILSGFILTYTHVGRMNEHWTPRIAGAFLWLRLARIWPVMFVMLLVFGTYKASVLLITGKEAIASQLDPGRFLLHVALLQAWTSGWPDWNGVDWSLSAEWLAYLVFAVFVVVLGKARTVLRTRALVVVAVAAVLPVVLVGLGMLDGGGLLLNDHGLVVSAVFVRVLGEFIAGTMVALLVLRTGARRRLPIALRPSVILIAVVATGLAVGWLDPVHRTVTNPDLVAHNYARLNGHLLASATETVVVVPLLVLLIGALAVDRTDPLSRLLASRPMVWGGQVSFALYMCHQLVLYVYLDAAPHLSTGLRRVALLATIVIIGLCAHLIYRLVEEPARRAMRAMLPPTIKV